MTTASDHHAIAPSAARPPILGIPIGSHIDQVQDDTPFDIKSYWHALYHNRWLIFFITTVITLGAVLYVLIAKPVYEANLMIHVEEQSSNASKNILSEASSLFETKKTAVAEIELLRSRTVILRALDRLHLYIDVRPTYFPVVGYWIANHFPNRLSNSTWFGHGGYIWGRESASVAEFEVPDQWLRKEFSLISLDKGRFRLASANPRLTFDGLIGKRYQIARPDGTITLQVTQLQGDPGARFVLRRFSRLTMVEAIQNALVISEQGKDSGIIDVKLHGDNPDTTYRLLSEIGHEYIRQNLARKTEEAEKSLAFLNEQLPVLKQQLEQAEDRYNEFRYKHNIADLQQEARISLEQAATARVRRADLIKRKIELLARFTENHPLVEAVNSEQQALDAELSTITSRIKSMPMLEQEESRLTRDIKLKTDLYTALLNTAQQLRLTAVGRVSNVHLVDPPMLPEAPIKPKRSLIVVLAATTGMFLGVVFAFMRKAVVGGIDGPEKIERMLRARIVYATIPYSSKQDKLMRKAFPRLPLLAVLLPEDPAVESLRSFRAALQFSMPHFRNNIVMFAGPTRGIGKSFVTANFAAIMASSGKRVLLIDGDLINGHLYRYFEADHQCGLSDLILGNATFEQVVQPNIIDNLDFIETGARPPNRSELLLHPNFSELLKHASSQYDLVLVDSPPILSGAESVIIGAQAGAVFMLAHANRTNEAEINEAINRLTQAGIPLQGVLLNGMAPRLTAYAYEDRRVFKPRKIANYQ